MQERTGHAGLRPDRHNLALVGRATELGVIDGRLAEVVSGRARVLLLEGEAGIGKSRLLAEALEHARSRGFSLLCGTADELTRSQPFGVVTEALGIARSSSDPRRAALAGLLLGDEPGLSGSPGVPAADWTSPAPDLPLRILEGLLDVLEETAARSPVVFALEDLHWADASSLSVVRAVARRLTGYPVALVGTMRPEPRTPELERLLDDLAEDGAIHLLLAPLDEAAVAQLVAKVVGAPAGPELMGRIGGAAGNPLFALELARALLDEGAVEVDGGWAQTSRASRESLPPAFVDLVLRRLRGLSPPTLEALQVASVLGPTFSVTDLSRVLDRPATALMEIVREAMAARLVEEAGTDLTFRHDLVQEAVYAELPAALRSSLHRQVGHALAAAGAPAIGVAHHLLRGSAPGDTEAVEWLERAAGDVAPHAPCAAANLLSGALDLVDPSYPRYVHLLTQQAMSLAWSGQLTDSQRVARHALDRRPGQETEAQIRLGLGRSLLAQGRGQEGVEQLDAGAAIPGLDDGLRAELWAEASLGRLICGDMAGAWEQAERAAEAGSAAGNHLAVCAALCTLTMVAQYRADVAAALSFGVQAVQVARDDPAGIASQHHPWFFLGVALMSADRFEEARETFETGRRLADQLGVQWGLPLYHMALAIHQFHSGNWDDAVVELEAAIAHGEDLDSRAALIWVRSFQAELAIHRDNIADAEWALAEAERTLVESGVTFGAETLLPAQAHLRRAQGDAEGALALLEQSWGLVAGLGMLAEAGPSGRELVPLALAAGRRDLAAMVTEMLEGAALQCPYPRFQGDALRCRGLLEDDPGLLLEAVAAYRRDPRPVVLAEALEDAASALGRAGGAAEARPLLEEALATYERLEARRDVARTLAALRALGIRKGQRGPRQRPKRGWQSLTETELQVVQLAVDGLANARIGDRLFISRRTVETHLSHVFAKLGVSSRRELAEAAATGQVESD